MYEYDSIIVPMHTSFDDGLGGIIEDIKSISLEELYERQSELEKQISSLRDKEPRRKRKCKNKYHSWVSLTHDYLDELRKVRDEIVLKSTHSIQNQTINDIIIE